MPVSKKTSTTRTTKQTTTASPPPSHTHHSLFHGGEFARKIFFTLLAIFLVYLIFWLGTLIRNNIQQYPYIGKADAEEKTITLDADATVTARPDIAMTTIGMVSNGDSVAAAQEANTVVMNSLIEKLKNLGVADDDIQTTNYNIYPLYNYQSEDGRELTGYEVNQNVSVKIRNLESANQVLALAGEVGANSVSGLQFTIDDNEVYIEQARKEALEKLYTKANMIAQTLGVRIVRIVSYDEYQNSPYEPKAYAAYDSYGTGGAPDIESGSMDVSMTVSVGFEIQ